MKKTACLAVVLFFFMTAGAQVRIRPMPEPGYDQRIRNYINQIRVVDTHEHLLNPAGFDRSMLDFMLLFRHYAAGDLEAAGMPWSDYGKLLTDSLTVIEKWKAFKPYWELTSNTAYNRAALLAADQLFGIRDINESTVSELSEKIRKAYQTDWYDRVLKNYCNIEYVVEDYPFDDWENRVFGDPKMFRYVRKFDDFVLIDSKEKISNISKWNQNGIQTLDDLVSALASAFEDARSQGIVAVKTVLAYNRTLFYENVEKEKAEAVFNRINRAPGDGALSFAEVKPLQDYMMRRVLDLADSADLPVQVHTGLNGGDIDNADPTLLLNLIKEYPDVRFILFHGSYPYGGELAVLAKKFSNVFIDLCWLYIISPSFSERYLHEWLETVPAGKIMAFGGDFLYVENVYSHLLMAREVLTRVLTDKVASGYFSEEEAKKIADMLLHDNAVRIFKLKPK